MASVATNATSRLLKPTAAGLLLLSFAFPLSTCTECTTPDGKPAWIHPTASCGVASLDHRVTCRTTLRYALSIDPTPVQNWQLQNGQVSMISWLYSSAFPRICAAVLFSWPIALLFLRRRVTWKFWPVFQFFLEPVAMFLTGLEIYVLGFVIGKPSSGAYLAGIGIVAYFISWLADAAVAIEMLRRHWRQDEGALTAAPHLHNRLPVAWQSRLPNQIARSGRLY